MATVAYNRKPRTPDVVVDETWFSDPELCRESKVCSRADTFWIFGEKKVISLMKLYFSNLVHF